MASTRFAALDTQAHDPQGVEPARHERHERLARVGAEGQRRIAAGTVVVVGLGATGGATADALVRSGVGRVRLVDRDVPETGNLHRQVLYDEEDVRAARPKAEAARRRLARIGGASVLEARVADLHGGNALGLLEGADVVVDGTDGFGARLVLNDACARLGVPWIYTGIVGTTVHGFPVVPGETACLRCYLGEPPPPGAVPTCEAAGVLGAAALVAAGFAATEALKVLAGRREDLARGLLVLDVWTRAARTVRVDRDPDCPSCAGVHAHLDAFDASEVLCGDAVLLRPAAGATPIDLLALASALAPLGEVGPVNEHLLRFRPRDPGDVVLTVFRDGRTVARGTADPVRARALAARYLGG